MSKSMIVELSRDQIVLSSTFKFQIHVQNFFFKEIRRLIKFVIVKYFFVQQDVKNVTPAGSNSCNPTPINVHCQILLKTFTTQQNLSCNKAIFSSNDFLREVTRCVS